MIANHIVNVNETKPIKIYFKIKGKRRLYLKVKIALVLMWLLNKTNAVEMTIIDGQNA